MTLKSKVADVKAASSLIHSAPTGESRNSRGARAPSVSGVSLLHRGELLRRRLSLIGRLPGLVRHAVDGFAAFVLAHRRTLGVGLFLEPVGEAVAAEARHIHQIDILNIGAGTQMLDQTPEYRGLKFCSGFVVDRHGRLHFGAA